MWAFGPRALIATLLALALSSTALADYTTDWIKTYRCTHNSADAGMSIQRTLDGGYIMAGWTRPLGQTHDDLWLVRSDADGIEIWSRQIGGSGDDRGQYVRETADGGFIVTGSSTSGGAGSDDLWLVKTDASGDVVWEKFFGGVGRDVGTAVEQTADGGYVVTGTYDTGGFPLYDDLWLLRTDALGDLIWESRWDFEENSDRGYSLVITSDGGYVCGGHSYATGGSDLVSTLVKFDGSGLLVWAREYGAGGDERGATARETADGGFIFTGYTTSFGAGGADVYLIKTDAAGILEWETAYGGGGDDYGTDVVEFDDGITAGYLVTGFGESFGLGGEDACVIRVDLDGTELWRQAYGDSGDDRGYQFTFATDGSPVLVGSVDLDSATGSDLYQTKLDASGTSVWEKRHRNVTNSDDTSASVQYTSDGAIIMAGWTRISGHADDDLWLVKTDLDGALLWEQRHGGLGHDRAWEVQETNDGGFVIVGETRSSGAGGYDLWLARFDATGAMMWERVYGGAFDDHGRSIQVLPDGGFILTGTFDTGGFPLYDEIWLLRTDSDGVLVWQTMWDYASNDDRADSVDLTADGGFIVGGHSYATGGSDLVSTLVKVDADGAIEWSRAYGGADDERGAWVRETADGGFIFTGYTVSYGAGGADVHLIRTDGAGNPLWDTTYGGPADDYGSYVMPLLDGGYLVAGLTASFGSGGNDMYLVRTDDTGLELWSEVYGGVEADRGYALAMLPGGDAVLTGMITDSGPVPCQDMALIKLGDVVVGVNDVPATAGDRLFANHPNPFNPYTVIPFRLARPGHVRVDVLDVQGRTLTTLLSESRAAGTHRVRWDGRDADGHPVASGTYVYRITIGDRSVARTMTLLK